MKVVIIDYGSGNLHSTFKSFEKVSAGKIKILLSSNAEELKSASHIVLPGVGAFEDCKKGILSLSGMMEEMEIQVINNKKPFLGICVGMQLLAEEGHENGKHRGFGWIKGSVEQIKPSDKNLKIPHMGWNELAVKKEHPFFNGIKDGDHAYFVHSYHLKCENKDDVLAEADYGGSVTAAIAKGNIVGTQFHPEKSKETGFRLIKNFMEMK